MLKLVKRWWPMIAGFVILELPAIVNSDSYPVNVICSILATLLFAITICFDENWKLKNEFVLKDKSTLEKLQASVFFLVFLILALIGYIFRFEGLIPFYARKNGLSLSINTFFISLFASGICTLIYKFVKRLQKK